LAFSPGPMWMWPALIVSILLGAMGQILMKIAMKQAGPIPIDGPILDIFYYFLHAGLSLPLIGAGISYGLSFLLWLAVLSVADLSLARPIMSAGYLLTLVYGIFAGEDVDATRIIGTLLIVVGIAFVVKSGLGKVSG
ncbi:MAG: hypothetical protein JNM27_02025, partial [Leptospirales bacterium]|nr:hypothetical protein [Leptospirales bacterium]